ncbi:hypothetical protein [Vibrio phage V-YDF132]|nr:hypothetical protein [Vibrio phage V-YDF132]
MKSFKLNPVSGIKRLSVYGRLVVVNQVVTLSDKDAKKYLDHTLNGVASFVECEKVALGDDPVVTTRKTGIEDIDDDAPKQDDEPQDDQEDDLEQV